MTRLHSGMAGAERYPPFLQPISVEIRGGRPSLILTFLQQTIGIRFVTIVSSPRRLDIITFFHDTYQPSFVCHLYFTLGLPAAFRLPNNTSQIPRKHRIVDCCGLSPTSLIHSSRDPRVKRHSSTLTRTFVQIHDGIRIIRFHL